MSNENEEPQVEEAIPEVEETMEEEQESPEAEEEIPEAPQDDSVVLSKSDYTKLNRKATAYDTNKRSPKKAVASGPDSIDLIKLGKKLQDYSDDELDFVTDFAKSKKPDDVLKALDNEFVQQGISAHRAKVEKEQLAVKPSNTQPESEMPQSLGEKLAGARTIGDKQKILEEAGLYNEPSNNPNKAIIG